jgi:DNA-binding transcriptional regulator/RsmH inhibitor MraZ
MTLLPPRCYLNSQHQSVLRGHEAQSGRDQRKARRSRSTRHTRTFLHLLPGGPREVTADQDGRIAIVIR